MSEDKRSPPSFFSIFIFGIATRLAVLAIGILLTQIPIEGYNKQTMVEIAPQASGPSDPGAWVLAWYRFDARHYFRIAIQGYEVDNPDSAAFLPLLPLFMRAGAFVGVNVYYAGLLIPNIAFALGLALFGRAVWVVSEDEKTVWRACALLSAFPTAFYYSAPYQESLGFLFSAGALLAWLRYRPGLAGSSVMVASLARQTSLMFAGAVLLQWVDDWVRGRKPRHSAWLVFGFAVASYLAFWSFISLRFGDSSTLLNIQSQWGRKPPSLLNFVSVFYNGVCHPSLNYSPLMIFIVLGLYTWWRYGLFWGALVLLPLALLVSTGSVMSMIRLVLSCFPVFYPMADYLQDRRAYWAVLATSICLQLFLLSQFLHGFWVA